jgi:hypothetical protein
MESFFGVKKREKYSEVLQEKKRSKQASLILPKVGLSNSKLLTSTCTKGVSYKRDFVPR